MIDFPRTADEFYALRDDRTSRCCTTRSYQEASCAVYLSAKSAATPAGQAMLLATANLLSRWCRRVTIVLPSPLPRSLIDARDGDLGALILDQMRDADPFGDFQLSADPNIAADIALVVGPSAETSARANVFIDAAGWLAGVSRHGPPALPPASDDNLLGAIAAACLGVAQVFKIALQLPTASLLRDGVLDLFRLAWSTHLAPAPWPSNPDVGKILMVGAGSVGSSAAYCMRLCDLAGAVTVVDADVVKIENFNRSPVFGRATVGMGKAEALSRHLAGSRLAGSAVGLWWDAFLTKQGRASLDFDVWLPLANEFGVRLAMQHSVPPLMVHGSTTANWGVNHARHLPGRDDCLADRFPVEPSSLTLACSTGKVETAGTSVDAALPFASMFAGLLVTAELVRAQLPGYPQVPNFALFDWLGSLDFIQSWDRHARPGCICRDQGRAFQDKFNGGTKYRPVFHV